MMFEFHDHSILWTHVLILDFGILSMVLQNCCNGRGSIFGNMNSNSCWIHKFWMGGCLELCKKEKKKSTSRCWHLWAFKLDLNPLNYKKYQNALSTTTRKKCIDSNIITGIKWSSETYELKWQNTSVKVLFN